MFFYSLREKRRKQKIIENHIKSMMETGALVFFDKKEQLGFVESRLLDYIKEIDPKLLEDVIDAAIKKVIDSRMNAEIQTGRNELIREKIKDYTIISS